MITRYDMMAVADKWAPVKAQSIQDSRRMNLADDKTYKAEYLGSGTFIISKPKRRKAKIRQSHLKNPPRGARK
jgi:hypothetical protein